ncbi:TonB-dependent receptor [Mariniphaga sediminis]|uniref:TonB-dependent receptor n=1 Tax=Mariniphaga sediminis TaxID=1628158 RepID=UPI0035697CF9
MKKNDMACCRVWQWRKLLLMMKFVWVFILVGLISASASESYSQVTRFDLSMKNAALKSILTKIEEKTEFYFFYKSDEIESLSNLSIKVNNASISEVLDYLLKNKGFEYEIYDRYILILEKNEGQIVNEFAKQNLKITGKVTDSDGQPLPGVTVVVKGTTQGTVTNADGEYALTDIPEDGILVFSFIGMKSQEIPVEGQISINVAMEKNMIGIEEVVAIGYGVVKKSDLTGAVGSVSSEKLTASPFTRVDQAMQGKTTGVQIQNTDGAPGGNVKIRIRGANSLKGNNNPLIVIDGFLGGNLGYLNPSEIQSVEVLKDASATAIYGSRGANGVILVTTKRGEAGAPTVSFDAYLSMQNIANKPSMVSASEYANLINMREDIFGREPMFTPAEVNEYNSTGTDYPDLILRSALLQNYQLKVEGGQDKFRYLVSGNFVNHEGIVINNSYKKYSIRSNMDWNISSKLSAQLNLYAISDVNNATESNGYNGTPVFNAFAFAPIMQVFDENGNYNHENPNYGPLGQTNPYALAVEPIIDNFSTTIYGYGKINYEIIDGLSLSINAGVEKNNTNPNSFYNENTTQGIRNNGLAKIDNSYSVLWQNTNQLNYIKTFNEKHSLNATAVFEQQHYESRYSGISRENFVSTVLGYYNLDLGQNYPEVRSGFTDSNIHSFLGRVNYSFASKYFVTVSMRADGSSKFGKDNRWAYFPSSSIAWRVSEEEWMKSLNFFSNFKLRASYGETGSQAAPSYSSLATLRTGLNYPFDGNSPTSGIGPAGISNPDLRWETTIQINGGFEMNWIENRLGLIVDIYEKNTTNLLVDKEIPFYTGTPSFTTNVGKFRNKGFEVAITATPLASAVRWESNLNFSHNITTAIDLGGREYLYFGGNRTWEGEKTGLIYGYDFLGTWKMAEAEEAEKYGNKPGDAKFVDQNEDGRISKADRTIIGDTQPDYTFGFYNQFSYKNFDLNFLINGSVGGEILNFMRLQMNNLEYVPTHADALNLWTPEKETDVPTFSSSNKYLWDTNDNWVEDGSYVRLKNITLGYQVPENISNKLRISSARIYLSAENLLTITNYSGFDPEITSTGDNDIEMGIDYAPYPLSKILTFGINLKF